MAPAQSAVYASSPAKAGAMQRLKAFLGLLLSKVKGYEGKSFKEATHGELDVGRALGVAFVIIGAVVALLVAAQLLPSYINAGANATSAITEADFGDDTANSLRPVFGLLVALGILVSAVMLILGYVKLKSD